MTNGDEAIYMEIEQRFISLSKRKSELKRAGYSRLSSPTDRLSIEMKAIAEEEAALKMRADSTGYYFWKLEEAIKKRGNKYGARF